MASSLNKGNLGPVSVWICHADTDADAVWTMWDAILTTPNDSFLFAPFYGETLNKNSGKLYILLKPNK